MVRRIHSWTVHCVGTGRRACKGNGKGRLFGMMALFLACLGPGGAVRAQVPILDIIKEAVKKVIVAADLEVERLQTETIGLQNAEKEVENDMEISELGEITGWVQDQRDLFAEYYQELREVKTVIDTYEEVKDMIQRQEQIVAGYRQADAVLRADQHFSAAEVAYMHSVLTGIWTQSVQNLQRLTMVITSLVTQMGDAGRLGIIDETGRDIDRNYSDLAAFSQQNFLLSMQRAKDDADRATVRAMYGMQ